MTFPIASPLRCTRPPVNTGAATSPHAASDGRPSGAETHLGPGRAGPRLDARRARASPPSPHGRPRPAEGGRWEGGAWPGRQVPPLSVGGSARGGGEAEVPGPGRSPAPSPRPGSRCGTKDGGENTGRHPPQRGEWRGAPDGPLRERCLSLLLSFPPRWCPSPLPTGGGAAWQPPGGSGGACARPAAVEGVRPLRGGEGAAVPPLGRLVAFPSVRAGSGALGALPALSGGGEGGKKLSAECWEGRAADPFA